MNRHFTGRKKEMANKYGKDASFPIVSEMTSKAI